MIYSPAEDSYLLEKYVKLKSIRKSVLDIGSGSGIQAKAALSAGASTVLASDKNKEVVKKLKLDGIPVVHSDLFEKIKGKFDLIIFNPPYLPEDIREDRESALATTGGKRGDEIILRFLRQVKKHLEKEGTILLILSSLTPRRKILKLLKSLLLKYDVLEKKKIFFETLEVWGIHNINKAY